MSMLAVEAGPTADPARGRVAPVSPSTRRSLGRAPLWTHALALAGVLLIGLALARPWWPSFSDEGAALAQVDSLASGHGWLVDHPYPSVDPAGTAFPIDLSTQKSGEARYAPLVKHPLYALLLTVPYRIGGVAGTFVVSVAGTVAAAWAAALLSRRFDPRLDRLTLWLAGLATPLFYDSYIAIAHTLGAAAIGFAVYLLTTRREPATAPLRWGASIAGGLTLLLLAQLLRNEAVLLGLALGAALVMFAVRGPRRGAVVGVLVLATTMVGYRLDGVLTGLAIGDEAPAPFTIGRKSGDLLTDRWVGFFNTTLRLPDASTQSQLLVMLSAVLVIIAAGRCRRAVAPRHVEWLFGIAGLCAAGGFLARGNMIYGLVFAAPVLVAGLVMLDGPTLRRPVPSLLIVTAMLFAAGVFATQYSDVGNSWGGRYLAIALPLVAPLAAAGFAHGFQNLSSASRRPLAMGLSLMVVALFATGVTSLFEKHEYLAAVQQVATDATTANGRAIAPGDGDPRPVVLATEKAFGRLLWPRLRDERWLTAVGDDVPGFAERLRAAGVSRLVVITADAPRVITQLEPWYEAGAGAQRVRVTFPLGRSATPQPAVVVFTAR